MGRIEDWKNRPLKTRPPPDDPRAEAQRVTDLLGKRERRWRREVLEAGGHTCTECGKSGDIVRRRVSLFALVLGMGLRTRREGLHCEQIWRVTNGRVVCSWCLF